MAGHVGRTCRSAIMHSPAGPSRIVVNKLDAVLQRLRDAVTGSGLRRDKIDAIGEAVRAAENADRQWMEVLGEFEGLAGYDPEESGEKNVPTCPVLKSCGMANADLIRIAGKFNEDAWLEISLERLEDQPVFECRARENQYIPFANASVGQQATALLKALLNQPGPPLIIDQREEDRDNPVMLQVVGQIWEAKKSRQLILSSHNANLVVNGDAELVVWCDYRSAADPFGRSDKRYRRQKLFESDFMLLLSSMGVASN